jgi:phage terminase large subunit
MVDYVVTLLAQGRVQVIDKPSNELFLEQHRDYRWNERTIYTDTPEVIKEDDHFPDAFQYLVCDNLRELGLIW